VGLGLFYEFFSAKLGFITKWGHEGFGVYSCGGYTEAGKTMGLAPYGQPRPDWGRLIDIGSDDFAVTVPQLEQAFETWLKAEGNGYHPRDRDSWQSPFAKDVARKAQDELEEAMLHLARRAHELTGKSRLCLSGGVALNSVANQRIAEEGPFSEIYIAPPAGDAGVAIGCASYGYHEILGGIQRKHFDCAATGRRYNRDAVLHAIKEVDDKVTAREATIEEVAALVASHQIVAWVQGGSEIGPRALGQRSIIADPRHPEMRDYLNIVVKHREPFRPYAPSVLASRAAQWFALDGASPFMLLVPAVHEDKRDLVPAITHVDGTARVQTVEQHVNPEYYRLISAFEKHTGVPLVLNTSYNDAGEPIVETPADALRTFLNTELDYLYLGTHLVEKRDRTQPANHPSTRPLARAGDST
jgi:carbamoyltransferase